MHEAKDRLAKDEVGTVILQIFGLVLFSVFSVISGFTEIKTAPK